MAASISRQVLEEFLYMEADLLDEWRLDEWIKLFTTPCAYLVPSSDISPDSSPAENLFYIADDRHRLEQRVLRLMKKTAHAEYPRSRLRHMVSNIRILGTGNGETNAVCNFATFRTNRGITDTYIGQHRYRLVLADGDIRIREKRSVLSMDALRPHGRISVIV